MEVNKSQEEMKLGLRLHEAETNIHIGRAAIRNAQLEDPLDEATIELHRKSVHESRLTRNVLRVQLQHAKRDQPLPGYNWI